MVWIMTPIIRLPGRDFLPEEIASKSPVVIANQAFVDEFLPGQNPIGQTFYFYKTGDEPEPDPVPQQIVGVVANARYNNLREPEGQPSTRRSSMRPPPRSTSEPPPGPLRWSLGCARKSKQPAPIPGSFEVRVDPVHFGSYKPIASAKCG